MTPYVSEDMDTLWLKVSEGPLNQARHEAAGWAREWVGDTFGRARYTGRVEVWLHDHEEPWDDDCGRQGCQSVPAWRFAIYEGPYREEPR